MIKKRKANDKAAVLQMSDEETLQGKYQPRGALE
jgi:RING finger protein 113A